MSKFIINSNDKLSFSLVVIASYIQGGFDIIYISLIMSDRCISRYHNWLNL